MQKQVSSQRGRGFHQDPGRDNTPSFHHRVLPFQRGRATMIEAVGIDADLNGELRRP
jgi:hypothetical protein